MPLGSQARRNDRSWHIIESSGPPSNFNGPLYELVQSSRVEVAGIHVNFKRISDHVLVVFVPVIHHCSGGRQFVP